MFKVMITVTYHLTGNTQRFVPPNVYKTRKGAEKAAAGHEYICSPDGVTKIVTHSAEVMEVHHA